MNKVESVARQNCKQLKSWVLCNDTDDNEVLHVDHTHIRTVWTDAHRGPHVVKERFEQTTIWTGTRDNRRLYRLHWTRWQRTRCKSRRNKKSGLVARRKTDLAQDHHNKNNNNKEYGLKHKKDVLPTVGLFIRRVKLLPLYLIPVRVCVCACIFAHMRTKWLFIFIHTLLDELDALPEAEKCNLISGKTEDAVITMQVIQGGSLRLENGAEPDLCKYSVRWALKYFSRTRSRLHSAIYWGLWTIQISMRCK